jgi:ATP-binding cassette, subfamily B, bacterial
MRGDGGGANLSMEGVTQDDPSRVGRRVWKMVRPARWRLLGLFGLLLLQVFGLLAGPRLVAYGIDSGMAQGDQGAVNLAAALYLALAVMALILGRVVVWGVSKFGEVFLRDLRERLFRHLMSLGIDFFESEKTGVLVSRVTSDIDALQQFVQVGIVGLTQSALLFVGAAIWIYVLSWQLALCVTVLLVPIFVGARWFRRESAKAYLDVRDSIGRNLSTVQEGLVGMRVVQAYAQEDAYFERFTEHNEAQFRANVHTLNLATRFFPPVEFGGVVAIAVILGVGGLLSDQGVVTVGTVAAFVLYLSNLFEPVQQLSQQYNMVQASSAAMQKVLELLDVQPSIVDRAAAVELPPHGELAVEHVGFGYGTGPDVLSDVTLRIAPGERVALVGPTGAGKSTLAKLMVRFYDPRRGCVRYGGVDLRDATTASLRERIVVVPQEGFLFSGTVRDNIRMGRHGATDADVEDAVAVLDLTARFDGLADGLDTEVRERGSRLSAGERQLVSLARAALADPAVLVLDEATSNLDPGTESAVERALEHLTEHRTVIVVAHRLSTAARADRVAVIDQGRLLELGTHRDLLRRGGRYASLFESWTVGQHSDRSG